MSQLHFEFILKKVFSLENVRLSLILVHLARVAQRYGRQSAIPRPIIAIHRDHCRMGDVPIPLHRTRVESAVDETPGQEEPENAATQNPITRDRIDIIYLYKSLQVYLHITVRPHAVACR